MKPTKGSTIIICGIVRNAERGLRRNIPEVKKLCQEFSDYRVFVYENDSTDGTKRLLKEWQDSDRQRVNVSLNVTCSEQSIPSAKQVGGGNPFYCRRRIEKMASLRNEYMEHIEKAGWEADYLMVIDLDVAWIKADNILTSFKRDDWDAVTAFGYSTSPKLKRRYHDSYALTEYGDEANPQTEYKIMMLSGKYAGLSPTDEWIRVFSAFGGLAIYRFEGVKGLRYTALGNDDKRVEVRCEHYSLCKQMSERGFDRIYINPAMSLKYQDLTFPIVWRSLVRMLNNAIGGGNSEEINRALPAASYVGLNYRCAA